MARRHLLHPTALSKQSSMEVPSLAAGRAPSLGYGAPNVTRFSPMQSRRQGVSVLLTYGGGNGPRVAGGGNTLRSMVGDGEGGLW
jgi:hypothetical protein